jgi:hypothetical protein
MSRYSCPQQISILPGLKVEIISVSCGRQHTLSLTNNGVSAELLIAELTTEHVEFIVNDVTRTTV